MISSVSIKNQYCRGIIKVALAGPTNKHNRHATGRNASKNSMVPWFLRCKFLSGSFAWPKQPNIAFTAAKYPSDMRYPPFIIDSSAPTSPNGVPLLSSRLRCIYCRVILTRLVIIISSWSLARSCRAPMIFDVTAWLNPTRGSMEYSDRFR